MVAEEAVGLLREVVIALRLLHRELIGGDFRPGEAIYEIILRPTEFLGHSVD